MVTKTSGGVTGGADSDQLAATKGNTSSGLQAGSANGLANHMNPDAE
jgi:hypothetical protein